MRSNLAVSSFKIIQFVNKRCVVKKLFSLALILYQNMLPMASLV
jgi:hypothetical protein